MTQEINYKNNPLNGVGLKQMLTELIDHYGFDILHAYLNINCFKTNPSVVSSVKFLKKTDWAREKVEEFYLHSFKSLPKASYQQSQLSPRDRIIPDEQIAGEPAVLSLDDARYLREERETRAADFDKNSGSAGSQHGDAGKQSQRSHDHTGNSASNEKRQPPEAPRRVASTADNPWGLPKE